MWASCYGVMAFLNPIVLALNNDAAPRVSNDYAAHGLEGLRRSVARSAGVAAVMTSPVLLGAAAVWRAAGAADVWGQIW